jgi:hypothetical protein
MMWSVPVGTGVMAGAEAVALLKAVNTWMAGGALTGLSNPMAGVPGGLEQEASGELPEAGTGNMAGRGLRGIDTLNGLDRPASRSGAYRFRTDGCNMSEQSWPIWILSATLRLSARSWLIWTLSAGSAPRLRGRCIAKGTNDA